jgi:hypothetical protein
MYSFSAISGQSLTDSESSDAEYSDPAAARAMTRVLAARRDKVARACLTAVNPLVDFALDAQGTLTFSNAAADARVAVTAWELVGVTRN